ncbi:M56 family metallopeptidase [Schumannella luteola]|uniref:Zn-dependent protease with chaperone function n=1 Tax=Schumannella luteola TaxID=472059 RepID=A0A852YRL7_9MICO|nr:Zn-dependent protease with chaperone function [Schumannella luteola]TPX02178.1 M56 family metallopeptidase [Schumannella luteola]
MLLASALLAALAVLLAVPVPILLDRAEWPRRAPATALVLWQAIALSGGLSMVGALATFGLAPFGDDLIHAAGRFLEVVSTEKTVPTSDVWPTLAVGAAALLVAHLVLNLALTVVVSVRERRRHRDLVTLLSSPDPGRPGTRLLDDPAPLAYCLPGVGSLPMTVLSQGLVELLADDELGAVVAHERAHLAQRHALMTTAFRAWSLSLPWFPIASRARASVARLVEYLADDTARASHGPEPLARAIALVGGSEGTSPTETGAADRSAILDRVRRVGLPPLPSAVRILITVGAVALVVVPTVLLLGPALLDG